MEPADIDWKNIESKYVRDEVYEHINAPKWLDLSTPDAPFVDDDAWFCRPDCHHPKTAEEFQRWTPSPKVKPMRSNSEIMPFSERNSNNPRDANKLKRRGGIAAPLSSSSLREPPKNKANSKKFREDLENQNPNLSASMTTPSHPIGAILGDKVAKEAFKSSAEKKGADELENKKLPPLPRLKSTLSARNLFSGRDILSQISEFCHEIKKLAVGRERPSAKGEAKEEEKESKVLVEAPNEVDEKKGRRDLNPNSKRNDGSVKKSSRLALKVETEGESNKKGGADKSSVLREVRACPPTPQRFPSPSSRRLPKTKASTCANSPLNKPTKSVAPERGILQELDQSREEKSALVAIDEDRSNRASVASDSQGSSLDMFWFLKPCTYLVK